MYSSVSLTPLKEEEHQVLDKLFNSKNVDLNVVLIRLSPLLFRLTREKDLLKSLQKCMENSEYRRIVNKQIDMMSRTSKR